MTNLVIFVIISLVNVFLHICRSTLVIKSTKLKASLANCVTYSFSAIVVKFISESSLSTAIIVAIVTNFVGCYLAMLLAEKLENKQSKIE